MSKQALVDFMAKAAGDGGLMQRILQTTGAPDFVALAKDNGFDLGDLNADQIQGMLSSILGLDDSAELSDDELDSVSAAGVASLRDFGKSLKLGGEGGGDGNAALPTVGEGKTPLMAHSEAGAKTPFILEVTSWMKKS